jgi:hypothetical protein
LEFVEYLISGPRDWAFQANFCNVVNGKKGKERLQFSFLEFPVKITDTEQKKEEEDDEKKIFQSKKLEKRQRKATCEVNTDCRMDGSDFEQNRVEAVKIS